VILKRAFAVLKLAGAMGSGYLRGGSPSDPAIPGQLSRICACCGGGSFENREVPDSAGACWC
jgi:hypothetical protein